MDDTSVKVDLIDLKILEFLLEDARKTYQEIATELKVSTGTVHVRINKLKEQGVITGSHISVDFTKLGHKVSAFIGVNLSHARTFKSVLEQLKSFPEVVDVHYTTGQYSLFVKILTKSTQDLHLFLIEKLQTIKDIQSTETFISLDNPVSRQGPLG